MLPPLIKAIRHHRLFRTIGLPVVVILFASLAVAQFLGWSVIREERPLQRAERLSSMGEFDAAEVIYTRILASGPIDVETLIDFIDHRAELVEFGNVVPSLHPNVHDHAAVDPAIERVLARDDLDESVSILGRFWYRVRFTDDDLDTTDMISLADANPPVRWANHLLGRAAVLEENLPEAAKRFEREGLAFPDQALGDLEDAVSILRHLESWDELRSRSVDSRFSSVVGPSLWLALAEHDRDWPSVLRWLWPASFEGVEPWPVFLAALSAGLWFLITSRLGRVSEGVPGRRLLYATAFLLGVLSVYPTLVLITVEEVLFDFKEVGQPVADAIYFVFGVGFREELSKLLLFLPLLPALIRRGSRIEALTCGGLVGLGFASEENINYFHMMDASAALGRFLTANFLHMSLTALIAVGVYDASRARERPVSNPNVVFAIAIALHGAYDFFLSGAQSEEWSFVAMALFVILSQWFLRELLVAAGRAEKDRILNLFVISLTILCGASYVYATTLVGPLTALRLMAAGLLGVAIMIYMFVRELGDA